MSAPEDDDPVVSSLPIHYSNALEPNIQLHQFPLLTRSLLVPPSAARAGKTIKARVKPGVSRIEVHVPVDARPEVWNADRAGDLGRARHEEDSERSDSKRKQREGETPELSEVRMSSERVPSRGAYMLGIVRDGKLHLHPISAVHQLRPSLTYMDVMSRKNSRRSGAAQDSDSDSDDVPGPDDVAPTPKKPKKPVGEAKEVQVSVKKTVEEKSGQTTQGGMTSARREILQLLQQEEEEKWVDLEYIDGEQQTSAQTVRDVLSKQEVELECKSDMTDILKQIHGL